MISFIFFRFLLKSDTPNGKHYINVFRKLFGIIYWFSKLFMYLPLFVREFIMSIICWIRSYPQELVPHILMIGRPSVMNKIVYMADDEMKKLNAPDYDLIEQNADRLTFFYSTLDGWTPKSYYDRLMKNLPNINVKVTDKFAHSFVINSSYEMGALLGEWIQQQNIVRVFD